MACSQLVAPAVALYVPIEQVVHEREPFTFEKEPGWHLRAHKHAHTSSNRGAGRQRRTNRRRPCQSPCQSPCQRLPEAALPGAVSTAWSVLDACLALTALSVRREDGIASRAQRALCLAHRPFGAERARLALSSQRRPLVVRLALDRDVGALETP